MIGILGKCQFIRCESIIFKITIIQSRRRWYIGYLRIFTEPEANCFRDWRYAS